MNSRYKKAAGQSQQVGVESQISTADPHKLVSMLLNGAIERYKKALYFIDQQKTVEKAESLTKALAIVDNLKASLNYEQGGVLVENLEALYDYVLRQTLLANVRNDKAIIDEVIVLMKTVQEGWDGIRGQVMDKKAPTQQPFASEPSEKEHVSLNFAA
jgi:flagellar protein FliS